jgi:Txe/YoeB family toxin of Txe-Axe toxin-antitoxin module
MKTLFEDTAFNEYDEWLYANHKIVRRINELISDIK